MSVSPLYSFNSAICIMSLAPSRRASTLKRKNLYELVVTASPMEIVVGMEAEIFAAVTSVSTVALAVSAP